MTKPKYFDSTGDNRGGAGGSGVVTIVTGSGDGGAGGAGGTTYGANVWEELNRQSEYFAAMILNNPGWLPPEEKKPREAARLYRPDVKLYRPNA